MDPNIWGPLIWAVALDICWAMDGTKKSHAAAANQKIAAASTLFFQSLQYLLPCKYCRESYTRFLAEMGGSPPVVATASHQEQQKQHACLQWIYDLKSKVNKKLDKHDAIPFEKIVARMKTYQAAGSSVTLIDALFIIAENYDADLNSNDDSSNVIATDKDQPVRLRKKAAFYTAVKSLTVVAQVLPRAAYGTISEALLAHPITFSDVESKKAVVDYLCTIAYFDTDLMETTGGNNKENMQDVAEKICKKYANARPPPEEKKCAKT